MSVLQSLVVACDNLLRPLGQDYEHLVCWYNVPPRENFQDEILNERASNSDMFGFMPNGLFFKDSNSASLIVETFKKNPSVRTIYSHEEGIGGAKAFFINQRHSGQDKKTVTIEGIVKIVSA